MKLFKITLLLLLTAATANAQNTLNFNFDYAQFGYDSVSNYVEFYYSFRQDELKPVKAEGDEDFKVEALLSINFKDPKTGEDVIKRQWKVNNLVEDTSSEGRSASALLGVVGFVLPEGHYTGSVTGIDFNDTTRFNRIEEEIDVKPRKRETFSLSDIELATNIKKDNANENSIFYKNTYEVMPNPLMLYNRVSPVMFYYSELYNVADTSTSPLFLRRVLYDSQGREVSVKTKPIPRHEGSIVEVGLMNLIGYPTDSYVLELTLIDTTSKIAAISTKKFYHVNPGVKDSIAATTAQAGYLGTEFAVLSEEEADDMFQKIKYIASAKEYDLYEKLDSVDNKREFLYKFWQARDMQPETAVNEFKQEYMNRVEKANVKFRAFNKPGYKTDRGRVFILYGEPDQIDRYPNESDKKPYEIWFYNQIEGGVNFIFGDLTGFSEYELLSSTKRGELRDDDWMRRIYTR